MMQRRGGQQLARVGDARLQHVLGASAPSPRTSGITATPVSKPERPSASFGNSSSDMQRDHRTGCRCCANRLRLPRRRAPPDAARAATSSHADDDDVDDEERPRRAATASQIASLKPLQEDPRRARRASRNVTPTGWCIQPGTNGFSTMCAVASAADSVMVMTKLVAANPSRHEDERLAAPARQPFFEHGQAALAVRAERGDPVVDGQRAEQREQHEHERRERREVAGGDETRCWADSRASRSSRRP